ncbi:MAG: PAS domain S-box protein [Deltaproteobacteria bacterium]|nr:PAS domain S-box protein [Deltaproteobacteria bacterium]
MKSVIEELDREGLLKTLFEAIPCGVLVVDKDRRVKAVNDALKQGFGLSEADVVNMRSGEVLRCVHADNSPEGCGHSEECQSCIVRQTALAAIDGKTVRRTNAEVSLKADGKSVVHKLLLSAAPFEHHGERFAVVMLEDISELTELRRRLKTEQSFAGIIGNSPAMQELFETIRDVADINVPIHIHGASGTGKELVASAIHNEGIRAKKPFVPINCAALPEGVLESELFGHVRGAFTGAIRDKKGRFELADGGTLFLDEVADMPKLVQAKLLRVLQEGKFERVGDEKTLSVDVRIISATNRDLMSEVEQGNFRDDLYYRLNVVPVDIPPLRERKNDIPLLVDCFLKRAEADGMKSLGVSEDALSLMIDYSWPGNIRELQSAIQFALIKSRGGVIQSHHLSPQLRNGIAGSPVSRPPEKPDAIITGTASAEKRPSGKLDLDRVRDALERADGNKAKAAKLLGVGRATLYRFLDKNTQ